MSGVVRSRGAPRLATPRPAGVIRFRPSTSVLLAVASALGVASFIWPLVISGQSPSAMAHAGDAPWEFAVLLPLLFAIVLSEIADGAIDAKAIAMLGVLAACGSALRVVGPGVAGFEPVFFLLVPAGRVLGRGFGFVLGAVTLVTSALISGGVGPWLPFQMFGAAWMGFGAGCLPRATGRTECALLAAYVAVASVLYGALLNLWFWPLQTSGTSISYQAGAGAVANLRHFVAFDLSTSLGFDLPRAVINAALILVLGKAVLAALRRASRRAAWDAPVTFAGPTHSGDANQDRVLVCVPRMEADSPDPAGPPPHPAGPPPDPPPDPARPPAGPPPDPAGPPPDPAGVPLSPDGRPGTCG
ncbi:MAG TPA: ECF transporter S component [Acidimicrobiales bacterium]|nr:ECF transporter S component [Acidimicrobiales bacterium]